MAVRPGEDIAAVLFADVHYYYDSPTAKPPHHRFDKGSYVYLFENASQRRARIEIANNAGTEDQDAFDGYLDGTHVEYSHKHQNLVTVIVDGGYGKTSAAGDEWHLATFDPHNKNKYMYKLHTLDVYFWTKTDALQFLNAIRRVLPPQQIAIQGEPVAPLPHLEEMSPVVQKLEKVAITDPSYQDGKTRDSRTTTLPGPPISATPQSREASNFAPMAYNPAAPAAPETIVHREKTPPPEDGAGNPLMAAAAIDQGQSFGVPYNGIGYSGPPQQTQQSYFPGPPAGAPASVAPLVPPQSPYAHHFQNTFAAPPTMATKDSPYAQPPPASAPPPSFQQATSISANQFSNYPSSQGFSSAPSVTSPALLPAAPTTYTTEPPPGGFSQYQYGKFGNNQPLMTDYSIHQQVYRPTEEEATKKLKGSKAPAAGKGPRGKLEDRADKLEKGMGSIFRKLEKKIG